MPTAKVDKPRPTARMPSPPAIEKPNEGHANDVRKMDYPISSPSNDAAPQEDLTLQGEKPTTTYFQNSEKKHVEFMSTLRELREWLTEKQEEVKALAERAYALNNELV